jgi:hypothetical protein
MRDVADQTTSSFDIQPSAMSLAATPKLLRCLPLRRETHVWQTFEVGVLSP